MSGKYAEAARNIARERGLHVLDMWSTLQALPNWQAMLTDGLHFAANGNEAVFNLLMDTINQKLPQFR